MENFEMK